MSRDARQRRRRPKPVPARAAPPAQALSAEDQVMTALGFDIQRHLRDEARAATAALRAERSPTSISAAVNRAAASAEREVRRFLDVLPPDPPIACADECAHCCSLRAEVTVAEVIHVAEHLRSTLTAERLAEVRARVLATARRIAGMGPDARADARVPCALLVADRCSVYDVRPFVCRACNSGDAATCEQALHDPDATKEVYAPQSALYHYAGSAMMRALDSAGLRHRIVELNTALAIALSIPDAALRWLAGEDIFHDVEDHPLIAPPLLAQ